MKKHSWCAQGSKPGRQNSRGRRIFWAMAAPPTLKFVYDIGSSGLWQPQNRIFINLWAEKFNKSVSASASVASYFISLRSWTTTQQPTESWPHSKTVRPARRCRRHLHDEQLAKRHNLRLSNRKFKQFTSKYKSRVIICSHRRFIRLETNALKRLNKRSEGSWIAPRSVKHHLKAIFIRDIQS